MNVVPNIKKWSDLRGMPVVSVDGGKKIGTCEDLYLDPAGQLVYAIRVKAGLLSHKVLPSMSISTIGQDAVTVAREDDLVGQNEDEKLTMMPMAEEILSDKVMSEDGTLVGVVGNILIDVSTPSSPHMTAFELTRGLRAKIGGKYEAFEANQVLSYGQDVLVISNAEAQHLSH